MGLLKENTFMSSLSETYTLPLLSTAKRLHLRIDLVLPVDPNLVIKLPLLSNFKTRGCMLQPGSDWGSVT